MNVGSGSPVTVLEVADALTSELGVQLEPEIRHSFRAGDIRHCVADIGRARELIGFKPTVTFAEGIRELAGWLEGQEAVDRVDEATAALRERGLTA
jgi:dTDP-L-rhamnose 4-epimerase